MECEAEHKAASTASIGHLEIEMIERKIGFIGAGLMAEALANAMLRAGMAKARDIYASDPKEERREVFERDLGAHAMEDNAELMRLGEIVFLSVKPQIAPAVVEEIAAHITPTHLVISIIPGIALGWLEEKLGTDRVVRVMPNTPALIGAGASAFCVGPGVDKAEAGLVEQCLSVGGICLEVHERLMDAVTGLSGSGPAFVYMVIEALSDGGVKMGLPRKVAAKLAAQTVLGAARMVLEAGKHPGELKDMVTTPGGTTIEGIHALERAGVRRAMMDAVEAATLKCRLLAEKEK
jgi:pyrroline-5-carboxylate reductase